MKRRVAWKTRRCLMRPLSPTLRPWSTTRYLATARSSGDEDLGHGDLIRLLATNLNEERVANSNLNNVALRKGVNKRSFAA
jgi:hypothetical protein